MQTKLTPEMLATAAGQQANDILRKCVHCGFCNATCPTYQLLGDELDGPRGRIYQIKQMLEGNQTGRETQSHLDRCLTCRNCETTCPSGVNYAELLSIGRELIETTVKRSPWDRFQRWCIRETLAYPRRFAALLSLAQLVRPFSPPSLRQLIPKLPRKQTLPAATPQKRKVLIVQGCVQPTLSPSIDQAAVNVLQQLGIQAILESPAACCGALHHHTSGQQQALDFVRRRVDAWWPYLEEGLEAIVSTASGCGVHIKDYGQLLANDPLYKDKAAQISAKTKDIAEVLHQEDLSSFRYSAPESIAYHPPCTLQHGQKLTGIVEQILEKIGIQLLPVKDSHICCGSAGSYSLLNPALSEQLGQQKVSFLLENKPDLIVTANIGCQLHLSSRTNQPVKHWIELFDKQ